MEVTGKIIKILTIQRGQGKNGEWQKQDFVVETADQYPKKICITAWGKLVDSLETYKIGQTVTAHINLESREYNEKWFSEIKAWKIDSGGQAAAPKQESKPSRVLSKKEELADNESDLPF
jgi:hypothetical protein